MSFLKPLPLEYDDYIYPNWAKLVGWCITISSILIIPAYALYRFLIVPGQVKQVRKLNSSIRSFLFEF